MNYEEYKNELEIIDNIAVKARDELEQKYLKSALPVGTYVIYKNCDVYKIWKINNAYVLKAGIIIYSLFNKSGEAVYCIPASDFKYYNFNFELVKHYLKQIESERLELKLSYF